jgi:hypothetical protein
MKAEEDALNDVGDYDYDEFAAVADMKADNAASVAVAVGISIGAGCASAVP